MMPIAQVVHWVIDQTATIPYTSRVKQAFPGVPVIVEVEASLRRLVHYDFGKTKSAVHFTGSRRPTGFWYGRTNGGGNSESPVTRRQYRVLS